MLAPAYAKGEIPKAVGYHQAIAQHYGIPEINVGRVLAEQIPRTGRLEKIEAFNRRYYDWFRQNLERHRDELCAVDLELASFVCVTSIEALTHRAVLHHPEIMSKEAAGALVDEATRLVMRYLQR